MKIFNVGINYMKFVSAGQSVYALAARNVVAPNRTQAIQWAEMHARSQGWHIEQIEIMGETDVSGIVWIDPEDRGRQP